MSGEFLALLVGGRAQANPVASMLPREIDGLRVTPTFTDDAAEAAESPVAQGALPGAAIAVDLTPAQVGALAARMPVICVMAQATAPARSAALSAGAGEVIDRSKLTPELLAATLHLSVCVHEARQMEARAAELAHRFEARFKSVMDQNLDGIVIVDESGAVLFANEVATAMFGESPADWVGQPFRFPATARRTTEIEFVRGGKPATVEMRVAELTWDGRHALLASLRDVTDRKALEDRLRQSQKMEAVGRLAGGVAHEFNNLLTAITGYADLLLSRLKDADGLRHDVYEIKGAASRASSITRQLLTFSRRHPVRPQVFDVRGVVKGIEPTLRRSLGDGIELSIELPPDAAYVKAEVNQIEQVLTSLAVNARDAMPAGGRLVIRIEDRVGAGQPEESQVPRGHAAPASDLPPGDWILITVRDSGQGIDHDVLPRIFEPFFTTKAPQEGSGLGLAIVYSVVSQCGGRVIVESKPGEGAAFVVMLPRIAPPAPGQVRFDDERATRRTILLVEDQDVVRTVTRRLLQAAGYAVLEAADGQQAMALDDPGLDSVDLLLTDVVMPVMSGVELAERLARRRSDLPVLYMSGFTRDEVLHDARTDLPAQFLQKPFTRDQLLLKVRDAMETVSR